MGVVDVFLEALVEILQHGAPVHLALGNDIEFFFNLSGEVEVHDVIKVLKQEVVDHHADVRRKQLRTFYTGILCFCFGRDRASFEGKYSEISWDPVTVTFLDISALLYRRDGWGIRGRTANAEFFQSLDQAGLGVARGMLGKTLGSDNVGAGKGLPFLHGRQPTFLLFFIAFVVLAFEVNFQEPIECDDLAFGCETLLARGDGNGRRGVLQFGIGHLRSDRALPN